jgi:hypothetical protein
MMEVVSFSEMSVNIYQITRCNILEDSYLLNFAVWICLFLEDICVKTRGCLKCSLFFYNILTLQAGPTILTCLSHDFTQSFHAASSPAAATLYSELCDLFYFQIGLDNF